MAAITKMKISSLVFLAVLLASIPFLFSVKKTGDNTLPTNAGFTDFTHASVVSRAPVPKGGSETRGVIPSVVPIFMYHYIREYANPDDPIGENLSVSPKKFEQQVAWLKENGYQTVSLNFFIDPQPLSLKPIILTFDDGYQDAYDVAFPILEKNKMTGTFYPIVSRIGTPGYVTWDEIAHMQKAGMLFGSHTLTHPDLRNLSPANLEKEIQESRRMLEGRLGHAVTDFCYPSGKYDEAVVGELRSAHYQTAVTTQPGIASLKDDPLLLRRLRIEENTDIKNILRK